MLDINDEKIIKKLGVEFSTPKRKTRGQDRENKQYHKITISVSKKEKEAILAFASLNKKNVSELIKNILKEKKILTDTL